MLTTFQFGSCHCSTGWIWWTHLYLWPNSATFIDICWLLPLIRTNLGWRFKWYILLFFQVLVRRASILQRKATKLAALPIVNKLKAWSQQDCIWLKERLKSFWKHSGLQKAAFGQNRYLKSLWNTVGSKTPKIFSVSTMQNHLHNSKICRSTIWRRNQLKKQTSFQPLHSPTPNGGSKISPIVPAKSSTKV